MKLYDAGQNYWWNESTTDKDRCECNDCELAHSQKLGTNFEEMFNAKEKN